MSDWRLTTTGFDEVTDERELEGYFGKSIAIRGPSELRLEVDFDDVPHDEVARDALKLVRLLNKTGLG